MNLTKLKIPMTRIGTQIVINKSPATISGNKSALSKIIQVINMVRSKNNNLFILSFNT
jgi:hypothetical protein